MEPFATLVFVCTGGGTCPHQGSAAVHAFMKEAVARAKLKSRVRVNHAGCLDQCGHGPMVVIYPDNVWYSHITVEEAQIIFSQHILGGSPVEGLRFRVGETGAHKLARDDAGRPTERCAHCRNGRAKTAGCEKEDATDA